MFLYVTFAATAVLAAAADETDWKTETTRTKIFMQTGNDMKSSEEKMSGPESRMEVMEREMTKLREVVQTQGEKMKEAKHEINQMKDTVQRQAHDMTAMTQIIQMQTQQMEVINEKLNRQEGIIVKQGLKLKSHEKEVNKLKLSIHKQDNKMKVLKKQNAILTNALRKQSPNTREDSTNKNENNCMYLQRDETSKDTIQNNEDNTQDLTKSDETKIKTVQNRIPNRNRRAGFQGWANDTGIAFSAYLGHHVEHMGIGHTIKCDQVLINDGNSYSTYTGTFTVPETGVYFLTFHIDALSQNDETVVKLVVNNRNIVDADANVKGTGHHEASGNSAIIRLNSGEKVWLEIYAETNVELFSAGTWRFVTFSGFMLY